MGESVISAVASAGASADWAGFSFRLVCIIVATSFGLLVAFDYRNFGLRVYDFLGQLTSAVGNSRMTPDRFRVVAGIMSVVGLGALVYQLSHI
ncbi:hypothetical protein ACIPSJ_03970 [Streptomyces sp. NPDC090088]|uniref:hypothetical protein n=1 Tax=Streptomyces sp. NPDC090088 TaxID=3365944 RepID=UPI00382489A3